MVLNYFNPIWRIGILSDRHWTVEKVTFRAGILDFCGNWPQSEMGDTGTIYYLRHY